MDAFLPRFVITAKEARAGVVAGRMHMRSKCRRTGAGSATRWLPAKQRHDVHRFVVNGSAPELFPAMYSVKDWFIRRETGERCAFDQIGISRYKSFNTHRIFMANELLIK